MSVDTLDERAQLGLADGLAGKDHRCVCVCVCVCVCLCVCVTGCERSKPRNETRWGVPACRTGTIS